MRLRKRSPPKPLAFEAYGVGVQIAVDDPALQSSVDAVLPPSRVDCDPSTVTAQFRLQASESGGYGVIIDEIPWIEQAELDVAIGVLDAQIRMFIASNAKDLIFVHAGAVARDGRAILIPGESFSGKTTLVAALVRTGATYFSDEYAVLDTDGKVHPYARPLSIRDQNGPTQERHVSELGGTAGEQRADVAGVVVTRYRAGAEWHPERLSAGEGVLALLSNAVPAQERPRESLQAISRAVRGATILRGDRGEASAVAPQVIEQLAAPAR